MNLLNKTKKLVALPPALPASSGGQCGHKVWKILFPLLLIAALVASLSLTGCSGDQTSAGTKEEQLYTCGMHPQVIQNKPGNCPICGMKLTPVRKQAGANPGLTNASSGSGERKIKYYKSTMNPGEVSQTPRQDSMGMDMVPVFEDEASAAESSMITMDSVTTQNLDLRTGLVRRGPVRHLVRTVGVIDFDETTLADVSTKFRGWIEKLYVDATGKQMHRGEPLFEIYSPELYLAQTEYLLTLGSRTNQEGVAAELRKTAAMTKLRYWDISEEQIAELERTRTPKKTLRMNAPRDGIVVEKMVFEGQMVEAGMKLYRLADLATVWIQAQVYEQDLPYLKLGQEAVVSLASQPEPKFRGRVTYIYPMVDEKTRTARVRMEFHNPGYFLKPGMYATVEMSSEVSPSALLVPDMAVLRSGEKNTVFVALDRGHFEPRAVSIGARAEGNQYEVLDGLKEGERVVTSGQFLLDSESQLREAIQKMLRPDMREMPAALAGHEMTSAAPGTGTNPPPRSAETVVYICPMPEHVSLEYDHPGKCPLCDMTLVPVGREVLSRIQPGGRLEYYTCPMPEHSDVHEEKPGKCPRCGMTLIPVMVRPKLAGAPGMNMSAAQLPAKLYTCPMAEHADIVSDKPGVCPKCGMTLVETSKVNHGETAEENWRRQHRTVER
ncbi:MAG TPA: efflux RND transporter periplasmic adaptor subunit [Candidatus Binatia bacterium]|jgi:Cu(I)/Ag(I) efflux system membrane fusion protein|nr:efflux RND transporter periplasmic adaptor subunit [Candidatus Binatia bacterium]